MADKNLNSLTDLIIFIKGAGDIASGVACRLYRACFHKIVMSEIADPLAVRRKVSFCEAVHNQAVTVEGIKAVLVSDMDGMHAGWDKGSIPVVVDPEGSMIEALHPHVVVDGIMAKRNIGTSIQDADLVIGLGPGFEGGKDVHVVVETNRGHNLGRLFYSGQAEPDTGIPGAVQYYTKERVLRSNANGIFKGIREIGDVIKKGEIVGHVDDHVIRAEIDGVIRGLIRSGTKVTNSLKIGDIDPRGIQEYCYTVSEKALALGGAVLEAILQKYNKEGVRAQGKK
ncbi:MAG: EF2563 family selenium-dependent molybdenum hydroxylase system protein [Deltaproteobacteria bacterium]|nr:EF2563 family selenium-dependent molybdenum hydroxylase system protein [Deltaproteobacteria bacterium]